MLLAPHRTDAAPRMISFGYKSCASCHFSVQGRGLLNAYGRGIDSAQSYSKKDFTAMLLGRPSASEDPAENWDGRIGNVLADFIVSLRWNERLDHDESDPAITGLFRHTVFFDKNDAVRLSAEVGFVDGGLNDTPLGLHQTATGGENFFLKKLALEWRFDATETASGKEIVLGRDYLPLGLQIDDTTTYILNLQRAGIYDYPLQLKYLVWNEKSLTSFYLYGPSFEESSERREYGGGFLWERYAESNVAAGLQGLVGFSEESDRFRFGPYVRWGISPKWTLLAQADYGAFWDAAATATTGNQITTFLQVFYHHREWLVSSATYNYAYSDVLGARRNFSSFRYTGTARLNRNLTLGVSFVVGDAQRNLGYTEELALFANIKF
jgi:hypothetical protein